MTMVVGVDVHATTSPPFNPVHPYIGMVLDVSDYIPFLGTNVTVNGLKRGVSDTGGMIIPLSHIPLAGPFLMEPVIGHESMNFFASQTVFCDGSRMSPKGYMVMTCNDAGIPFSAGFGKSKAGKTRLTPSLFAPTSFSLPVPTGKPVTVGGPYAPDWGGAFAGLVASIGFGALMKLGGKAMKKALTAFNHKVLKNPKIQKMFPATKGLSERLCKHGFEPVDLVSGAVVYQGTDFALPSPLPLEWDRSWYSDSEYEGWLGHGVHCRYDRTVEAFPGEGATMLRMEDGRAVAFPLLEPGGECYLRSERTTLRRTDRGYEAYDHGSLLTSRFCLRDGRGWRLTEVENPDGLCISLSFSDGRLTGLTDPAGRRVHAVTDGSGRVTSLSLEAGGETEPLVSYDYGGEGDMTGITDALGKTTRMEYRDHLMTSKTDRNGDTFHWEYDGERRCVHTYGPDGIMEGRIEYHPDEGFNLVTDATGGVTTYRYTPGHLVTAETDPLGNETRHSYTEHMEPYRTIDPEGGVTGYCYDDMGNLTGVAYPDGTGETFVYDGRGHLTVHVDREGGKDIRIYDEGRPHLVSRYIDRCGNVTEYAYDGNGQPTEVTGGGRHSEMEYDSEMNLVLWREDGRKLAGWEYDHRGRLVGSSRTGSRPEAYAYDPLGRVVRIDARDGNVIHLGYDSYDGITEARDAHRHIRMGYNPVGGMTWREEAGRRVSFRYDGNGRLREVVNEEGSGYRFGRDLAGNVTVERDYGGTERRYHRDACGRVTSIDRPGGRSTQYAYDAVGRVVTASYHDGTREEYGYDRNGLLISADNGEARIRIERDAMGRVTRESTGLPKGDGLAEVMAVGSEYDEGGRRTRVRSTLGADTTLAYDALGLVTSISAEVGGRTEGTPPLSWESGILRDEAGRETERFATGGIRIATAYDGAGMVRSREVRSGGRLTGWRSYQWDVGARLRAMRCDMRQEPVIFSYDALCNLVRGDYSMGESIFRTPDKVGNLYREPECGGRKYDRGGRLLWDGEFHYLYDCEGNLTRKSRREPTLEDGEALGAWQPGDTCYEWQANGMLAGVRTGDGKDVTFGYDALGRRIAKTVGGCVRRFGWDGNVVLHEWEVPVDGLPRPVRDADGAERYDHGETYGGLVTWVYDGLSLTPVAKVTGDGRYTIVHDYMGTPVQAYDDRGGLVWEAVLDVYGQVMECGGDRTFIPFRYQGQYEDTETGLYYNRFRYYSPDMGMYISADPIGLEGNNPTLYGYVQDTNTWIDWFGLHCSKKLANNLIANGTKRPPNTAAHHIVGSGERAKPANDILAKHGIDVDSHVNGVFLPNSGTSSAPGLLHTGRHTNDYIDRVNREIAEADRIGGKDAVIAQLDKIRKALLNGTYTPPQKI